MIAPEKIKQFEDELKMVLAIAAQIYPCSKDADVAVREAIALCKAAETQLKEHYEQPTQAPDNSAPQARSEPPVPANVQPRSSRETVNKAISLHSEIIIAKKLRSIEELRAMVAAHGVKTKEQLTDQQADELLNQLREIVK